jgi:hypothetical protein
LNVSFGNKGRLQRGNDFGEEKFQSVGKNLRDDFVYDVTKTYGPELVSGMRATGFRN